MRVTCFTIESHDTICDIASNVYMSANKGKDKNTSLRERLKFKVLARLATLNTQAPFDIITKILTILLNEVHEFEWQEQVPTARKRYL